MRPRRIGRRVDRRTKRKRIVAIVVRASHVGAAPGLGRRRARRRALGLVNGSRARRGRAAAGPRGPSVSRHCSRRGLGTHRAARRSRRPRSWWPSRRRPAPARRRQRSRSRRARSRPRSRSPRRSRRPPAIRSRTATRCGSPCAFPLPLLVGPVPLAVAVVGAGIAAGPLLLADERFVAGIVATVIGFPLAYLLVRSLHALGARWLVHRARGDGRGRSVHAHRAGADAPREHHAASNASERRERRATALDLRLGTPSGNARDRARRAADLRAPARHARTPTCATPGSCSYPPFAPTRCWPSPPNAGSRRSDPQARAIPPPSTTSPS